MKVACRGREAQKDFYKQCYQMYHHAHVYLEQQTSPVTQLWKQWVPSHGRKRREADHVDQDQRPKYVTLDRALSFEDLGVIRHFTANEQHQLYQKESPRCSVKWVRELERPVNRVLHESRCRKKHRN